MDLVQFVDRIDAAPTVRLDLNDGTVWRLLYEGTDFSPPPLKASYASTLLTDGERQTASAYENRRIRLSLVLTGSTPDDAAARLRELWRELDRDGNVLRWQPAGVSQPVHFRTIRSSETRVVDLPGGENARSIDVTALAEPFAYGLREGLPSAVVSNDPAAPGPDLNPNPYFETDTAGWIVLGGTMARSTAQAHEGVASLLLTPDGTSSTAEVRTDPVPVTAGRTYRVSAWVRCAVARSVAMAINWYQDGSLLSQSVSPAVSVAANTWTLLDFSAIAPAAANQSRLVVGMAGTPPTTHLLYVDEARLRLEGAGGGCWMDVTGVKGDVATPLVLRRSTSGIGVETLLAVRRGGDPSIVPLVLPAEAMTQGTDTSVQPSASVWSGGDGNSSRCTFATNAGYAARLSMSAWPLVPSADARGTWRVFARLKKNGTQASIRVRLRVAGLDLDEAVIPTTTTAIHMLNLGLVQIPTGPDPVCDGPAGTPLPAAGPSVELWATRSGAADTLDVDYLIWVPADDRLAIVHWPVTSAGRVVADGVHDLVYASGSGEVASGTPGYHVGGLPLVSPGVTNRIVVLNEVAPGTAEPAFPATATWDAYYWPRYLTVRGASS